MSLLSILSKAMESIVSRSVVNFLERENVLSAHQFGFRRRLCTADLLTLLQNKWSSTSANRGSVHTLAVDIAGAFDKVSHKGALAKAQACGISGTLHTWLQDYLSNRSLRAVVCGQEPEVFPVRAGVPQGSILFVVARPHLAAESWVPTPGGLLCTARLCSSCCAAWSSLPIARPSYRKELSTLAGTNCK